MVSDVLRNKQLYCVKFKFSTIISGNSTIKMNNDDIICDTAIFCTIYRYNVQCHMYIIV